MLLWRVLILNEDPQQMMELINAWEFNSFPVIYSGFESPIKTQCSGPLVREGMKILSLASKSEWPPALPCPL